jgi:hypothetical protein
VVFLWVVTLLAACVSAFVFAAAIVGAKGAPQEAAGAAIALCIVVIPYVFTRAIEGIGTASWRKEMLKESRRQT